MNCEKLLKVMKERDRIWKECQDNWDDGISNCCNETIAIIKEDIPGFIKYLKRDCSSRDFLYITDWFDELIEAIPSQELIDAFRYIMNNKFIEENKQYNIARDLKEAIEHYGKGRIR